MVSNKEIICPHKLRPGRGGAAMKEGCRILASVFLSLLLPLSFLLLARLSTARYFLSITDDKIIRPQKSHLLTTFFLHSKTTLILSLLVLIVTIAALTHCLTGSSATSFISERRRLYAGWVLLFLMQVCLSLGIFGTIDAGINIYAVGNFVLPRIFFFALGLHETMIFWLKNVVEPVVDVIISGLSGEGFSIGWMEKVVLAVAFGNLWWRRLRMEAEALVVLPWVTADLRLDVGMAGAFGWLLYYLTAAIGAVRVVKGLLWVVTWIFRYRPAKIDRSVANMDDSL